jgi:hypothetical protein
MKNWLPLEFGPLFAMLTMPLALCLNAGRISSSKSWFGVSYIDVEALDFGSEAGLPVCTMKFGMRRWKGLLV